MIVSIDTSERRNAELELSNANQLLSAVHEANPDLQFVLEADGTIIDVHANEPEKLYLPLPEILGRRMQDVLRKEVACPQLAGVTLVREAHARINGEDLIPIAQILGNIQTELGTIGRGG